MDLFDSIEFWIKQTHQCLVIESTLFLGLRKRWKSISQDKFYYYTAIVSINSLTFGINVLSTESYRGVTRRKILRFFFCLCRTRELFLHFSLIIFVYKLYRLAFTHHPAALQKTHSDSFTQHSTHSWFWRFSNVTSVASGYSVVAH